MMRTLTGLLFIVLALPSAFAAEITKIKGKSVLIELGGDAAAPGDQFWAMSEDGKRKALITIGKVKGDKAIGKITKGKPAVGMSLDLKVDKIAKGKKVKEPVEEEMPVSSEARRVNFGALFGYAQNSMSVNVNILASSTTKTADMSGSGFSGKALLDYRLLPQVWFRGTAGVEMFNASGGSICGAGNVEACDTKITYLTFDFMGRYLFSEGKFRPWLGAGVSLLFPVSKSTSALAESSIGPTSMYAVAGGGDIVIAPNMYVPIQVEYGMLPNSDEVEASSVGIRLGVAYGF